MTANHATKINEAMLCNHQLRGRDNDNSKSSKESDKGDKGVGPPCKKGAMEQWPWGDIGGYIGEHRCQFREGGWRKVMEGVCNRGGGGSCIDISDVVNGTLASTSNDIENADGGASDGYHTMIVRPKHFGPG